MYKRFHFHLCHYGTVSCCSAASALRGSCSGAGTGGGWLRPTRRLLADDGGGIFERYSEIDNSNEKRIKALRQARMCDKTDEWIATEKVHGANFGIYSIDYGAKIRYSKRSGLMPDGEHFFGYHVLLPELVACIRRTRELLEAKLGGQKIHTVIINGELFGGKYEHPNVPKSTQTFSLRGKNMRVSAVQNDQFPQYSPNLHFYAFDIKYRLEPPSDSAPAADNATTTGSEDSSKNPSTTSSNSGAVSEAGVLTVMYDDAVEIFEQIPNLLYAKAIVRGTMDEVAAFDVENFQTTIPALLGLGDFPLKGNWAEGVVVKHAKRGLIGWEPKGPTILKFKSVAFQEISTDKAGGPRQDQMADIRKESIARAGVQLPRLATVLQKKEEFEAADFLLRHVCDNRLKNVLSKMGPEPFISKTMTPNALADLLAKDALKDFLKDTDAAIVNASLHTRSEMCRYCLFESRKLVCKEWAGILNDMQAQHSNETAANGGDSVAPSDASAATAAA